MELEKSISNLEIECDERNQKAEFYEEMSEHLVKENENMMSKIKQLSEEKQKLQILIEMQKWKLNNYTVKYNCEDCGELMIKENEIEEHKTIHRETMQFEEAEITNDIVMNTQPNPQEKSQPKRVKYDCETCGKLFFMESERLKHEMIHKKAIPIEETENIGDIVKNKQSGFNRSNPQEKSEPKKVKESTFCCEKCGKEFNNRGILIGHMKNHNSQIGSHSCSSCMETFGNKEDLKEHMKNLKDVDHNCNDTFLSNEAGK